MLELCVGFDTVYFRACAWCVHHIQVQQWLWAGILCIVMLFIELKFWNYVEMKMMRCNMCIQYTAGTAWHEHKISETA